MVCGPNGTLLLNGSLSRNGTYISHRMREIMAFADDCSIFRNGRHVKSFSKGSKSGDEIVKMMIGRDYKDVYTDKSAYAPTEPPVLAVRI